MKRTSRKENNKQEEERERERRMSLFFLFSDLQGGNDLALCTPHPTPPERWEQAVLSVMPRRHQSAGPAALLRDIQAGQ